MVWEEVAHSQPAVDAYGGKYEQMNIVESDLLEFCREGSLNPAFNNQVPDTHVDNDEKLRETR